MSEKTYTVIDCETGERIEDCTISPDPILGSLGLYDSEGRWLGAYGWDEAEMWDDLDRNGWYKRESPIVNLDNDRKEQ